MQPGALMLDLKGSCLTEQEKQVLLRPGVGGVILFARNIETAEQVTKLTASIRALRPELLLAVDQEGGRVQRLRQGFTKLPPLRQLGYLDELDAAVAAQTAQLLGRLMAEEVLGVGLDFSFAPVLDLDYGQSEVIGDRALSSDPERLIALATAYIQGLHQAGVAAVGKHYPGHGQVAADSHTSLPEDKRSLEQLRATCLKPFAALAPHLEGIMPAHVIYSEVDDQPAGFSRFWLDLLRDELNFSGMIFSDDLSMAGAAVAGDYPARAQAALAAGCDQLLVCNQPEAALQVLDWLEQQQLPACDKAAALKARPVLGSDWLTSPEALLARQLAEHLCEGDLQAALHLMK